MFSFLLNPITAAIGLIVSAVIFWWSLFSRFSYMIGDFFNMIAPCIQQAGASTPCQAMWNIHVGMTALVVGIIFAFILLRWALKTFGRIFISIIIGIVLIATIIALLTYYYAPKYRNQINREQASASLHLQKFVI